MEMKILVPIFNETSPRAGDGTFNGIEILSTQLSISGVNERVENDQHSRHKKN